MFHHLPFRPWGNCQDTEEVRENVPKTVICDTQMAELCDLSRGNGVEVGAHTWQGTSPQELKYKYGVSPVSGGHMPELMKTPRFICVEST